MLSLRERGELEEYQAWNSVKRIFNIVKLLKKYQKKKKKTIKTYDNSHDNDVIIEMNVGLVLSNSIERNNSKTRKWINNRTAKKKPTKKKWKLFDFG